MHSPHLGAAALLAALVTLLGLVASPAPAAPATPTTVTARSTAALVYETQAHRTTNVKRVYFGRRPLVRNACLTRMARAQALRMARRGNIFHQSLGPVQRTCRMGWVGENVAFGFPTGGAVVNGWMASPGHRANILRREFRQQGIGAVSLGGRWYVAQVFGTPR